MTTQTRAFPTDTLDHQHAALVGATADLTAAIDGLTELRDALRTQDPERIGAELAQCPSFTVPASTYTALRMLRARFGGKLTNRDARCEDCLAMLTDCACGAA